MVMKKLGTIVLLGFLVFFSPMHAKNVIFDLGGVLFDTDSSAALYELGRANIIEYIVRQRCNPFSVNTSIRTKFFSILDNVARIHFFDHAQQYPQIYDEHGTQLPYLMYAWLKGELSCDHIRSS